MDNNFSLACFFRKTLLSHVKPEPGVAVHRDWSCHKSTIWNFSYNPWQQASVNNSQNVPSCIFYAPEDFSSPSHCFYKIVAEEVGAVGHWAWQRNGLLILNRHLNYLHNTNPGLTESNHKNATVPLQACVSKCENIKTGTPLVPFEIFLNSPSSSNIPSSLVFLLLFFEGMLRQTSSR